MKYSEDKVKPLSHQIHTLLYKKQDELNKLKMRPVTPFGAIKAKREEIYKLEERFKRQIAWERLNDNGKK